MMNRKLGVVMDPLPAINTKKDSTYAMLLEAQSRGWQIHYIEQADLYIEQATPRTHYQSLQLHPGQADWYSLGKTDDMPLAELDVILMRKDPPFDMRYIYTTYILEMAQQLGVLVANDPRSLRDANEKLFTLQFPQCIAPTQVSASGETLRAFIRQHVDVILKPLDSMGGASIFRVRQDDPNLSVIIETLTQHGKQPIMAQRFIPEIRHGDKRILIVDGEAVPYSLARIPAEGETRGNLAAGGRGVGQPLTERDHWICTELAPTLKKMGLMFVGIDVIGDYLTEINITSPTCIRELDQQFNLNISAKLFDAIEQRLNPS